MTRGSTPSNAGSRSLGWTYHILQSRETRDDFDEATSDERERANQHCLWFYATAYDAIVEGAGKCHIWKPAGSSDYRWRNVNAAEGDVRESKGRGRALDFAERALCRWVLDTA